MEVNEAVLKAKNAFPIWSSLSVEERIEYMKKLSELLEKEKADITEIIMKEVGKPEIEAETEVIDAQASINHYSNEILKVDTKKMEFDEEAFPDTEGYVEFVPFGVIGLITPWNYPLSLPIWTIVPALLAGNTIIFKPSEYSTEADKKINELLNKVLPDGVFNTVLGGDELGKELVKSEIDKLFFTGSVKAGKDIMKNIGIKPVSLELGGKDAFIVCEDADIDLTVKGLLWGATGNCGQVCVAAERVYVNKKIAEKFVKNLVKEAKGLKKGKDIGDMINEVQIKKVESHIKDAVSKGAKILCGGKGEGLFFEPTVLTNVSKEMKIMTEETFGSVIPVIVVESDEEAISFANNSKFGLGATIWSKDIERGRKIGKKLNVGMIWINDINLPFEGGDYWGGTKESGLVSSESKVMQCLKKKSFIIYKGKEKRGWWYPYGMPVLQDDKRRDNDGQGL